MKYFFVLLFCSQVFAAETHRPFDEMKGGCKDFKIPIQREIDLWKTTAENISAAVTADTAQSIPFDKKINFHLTEQTKVKFPVKPEKNQKPAETSFGGIAKVTPLKTEKFKIAFGHKIWVDVIDQKTNKLVKSSRFEMQSGCDSVHKVVEFLLESNKSYIIQMSSSETDSVAMLVGSEKL